MGAESVKDDAREFLAVVGVAVAGLVLAAVAAFTPWYQHSGADPAVIEVHGPVGGTAGSAARR